MAKNYSLLFVFFCGIFSFTLAQDFAISTPVSVAPGYGNYHPQMEVLGDQELGVIWTNSGTNQLYFAKRNVSESFSPPIQLNPAGTEVQDYNWSGPDLCAEGSDVYVVYHDLGYETGHIYVVKSEDYGVTFGDTVRVDNLVTEYAQFPDIAVYNDTVYVTYMTHGFVTMNPQMVLSRSVDGGQTFEAMVDASAWLGEEVCDCCQPEIVVDAERVIVFYRQNVADEREIRAVVSYDRGATFSEMYSPDDHNWVINACPSTGADARFLENGNPVCIYKTYVSGQPKLFVNEYDLVTDNTVNLVDIYADDASNTGINYPQIAVEGSLIGLVWEGLGSGTDVYFNASNTGVADLLPSNAINVTNITSSQSKPDIAILNGAFHLVYSELSGAEVKYVRIHAVNAVEENNALTSLSLYPNPAENFTQLDVSGLEFNSANIQVCDLSGRVLFIQQIQTGASFVSIDLSGFSTGTYLLKLAADEQIRTFRFVKN
jgi:hypothetical protein